MRETHKFSSLRTLGFIPGVWQSQDAGFLLFEQRLHGGVTCGDDEKFLGSDIGCSNHANNNSNNKTINFLEMKNDNTI